MLAVSLAHFEDKFHRNNLPVWKAYQDKSMKKMIEHNYDEKDIHQSWLLFERLIEMYPNGNTLYVVTKTSKTANDDNVMAVEWGNGGSTIGSSRNYSNQNGVNQDSTNLMAIMMQQQQQTMLLFQKMQEDSAARAEQSAERLRNIEVAAAERNLELKYVKEERDAAYQAEAQNPMVDALAQSMPALIAGFFNRGQVAVAGTGVGTIGQRTDVPPAETSGTKEPMNESKYTDIALPASCDRFLQAEKKMRELWPDKHPNDIIELLVMYAMNAQNKPLADTVINQIYAV